MWDHYILFSIGLTLFAGLSTGIGGLLTVFFKKTNNKLISIALGFSAGVMIYISFAEIFPSSRELLISSIGKTVGSWVNVASFFAGMLFIAIIDKLVPSFENPHEMHKIEEIDAVCDLSANRKLMRTGVFTALVIAIHNFPEGMATFMSSLHNHSFGIAIAIAVAIHNIPEGISVAIPIFCASGSKRRALWMSFLSGLAEPAGALIAYLILMQFLNDFVFGVLFGVIAGIMVFISFDELLPTAREYGEHHYSIYGLIAGMIIMSISLLLFM